MPKVIRVLIVDDHPLIREGLHAVLGQEADIELVGQARGGLEAVQLAAALHPDVVLMDLLMPGMDGVMAAQAIRRDAPRSRIIILTSVAEASQILPAARAGAVGYVLKNAPSTELLATIRAVMSGQVVLPAAIVRALHGTGPLLAGGAAGSDSLTEREVEIIKLVAQGLSNDEIARRLVISSGTVAVHVSRILVKLGLKNRTQAALYAIRQGWTEVDGAS